MYRSPLGDIVEEEMLKIPTYNKRVSLDTYIVMPNHIHCIITLGGYDYDNGIAGREDETSSGGGRTDADALTDSAACTAPVKEVHELPLQESTQARTPPTPPLSFPAPSTIRLSGYTSGTQPTQDQIKQYRKLRRKMIIPKIIGKLKMQTSQGINIIQDTLGQRNWHPDYHDHVIRNIHAYHRIYNYIKTNPQRWDEDTFR
jgi:REP element-mobilizing transposase RayT